MPDAGAAAPHAAQKRCSDSIEAPRLLRALPWVHGVTQLGIRLRVLVDRGRTDSAGAIRAELARHGIEASIERTHASLEDVFVVATRRNNGPATRGNGPEQSRG